MLNKKKIFWLAGGLLIAGLLIYLVWGIVDYLDYKSVAQAQSVESYTEAGKIRVIKQCILDTPVIAPIDCTVSCTLLSASLKALCVNPVSQALACISAASANPASVCADSIKTAVECVGCANYRELDLAYSQKDTLFLGTPLTFTNYKGGGVLPQPNMQFIWKGSSNISPWVMGIPSAAASRVQKLVDAYDFIIAGFKSIGK